MAKTEVTGAAGRYANALYELALEQESLDATESDLRALKTALKDSDDLARMVRNPLFAKDEKAAAMQAVAEKMGLSGLVRNVVGVMGRKGRLDLLPAMIAAFETRLAEARDETTAEVRAAHPLSDLQREELAKKLSSAHGGREVKLDVTVDESLIGGLVVKVGSRMIDTSIRTKLDQLRNQMKEVG